jgi:hypothetical protein
MCVQAMVKDKHHYLPQFYLKNFIDRDSRFKSGRYLWQADLLEHKVSQHHPRNVAYIRGFNDWSRFNRGADSAEHLYSQFETKAAPLIEGLISRKYRASGEQRLALAEFIGLQITRVPSARKEIVAHGTKYIHLTDEMDTDLDDRELEDEGIVLKLRQSVRDPSEVDPINRKDFGIAFSFYFASQYFAPIYESKWITAFSSKYDHFVTTDSPVLIDRSAENSSIEILYFPLSPRCLLIIENRHEARAIFSDERTGDEIDPFAEMIRCDSEFVRAINVRLISEAERYVFTTSRYLAELALRC